MVKIEPVSVITVFVLKMMVKSGLNIFWNPSTPKVDNFIIEFVINISLGQKTVILDTDSIIILTIK